MSRPADDKFLQSLLAGLGEGSASGRRHYIALLGRHYPRRCAEALLPFLDDPEPQLRGAAAKALGGCGEPAVAARLEPLLLDNYPPARAEALAALFRLNSPARLEKAQALLGDAAASVRKTAASLLASCGEKAVPALERALADAEPLVRLAAARALAQAAPQAPSVEKLLRKLLLEDPDAGVRAGLASFLK